MTEFEQQVAEALRVAFGPATTVVYAHGKEIEFSIFDHLAPRVAAAIAAAEDAGALAEHNGLYGEKYKTEVESAGLAGLLGNA